MEGGAQGGSSRSYGPIRRLSDPFISQIAAGEVVERPAAALKELVENSLDAGADDIRIFIENGGKTRIAVHDNGRGMSREDLALCVLRHTTSKLPRDSLKDIAFFGFRGEALAAMASVSRLVIASRQADAEGGWSLSAEGGALGTPSPCPFEGHGCRVEVRDLFFATPARLKFMRAQATEKAHIMETLIRFAIAQPSVRFRLWDGPRLVLDWPAAPRFEDRLALVLEENLQGRLLPVGTPPPAGGAATAGQTAPYLWGYVGAAGLSFRNTAHIRLYVNGRSVADKILFSAIREALGDILPPAAYPAAVLFLSLDPADLDVNVHPAKTEVRFYQPSAVRRFVVETIRARSFFGAEAAAAAPLPRHSAEKRGHRPHSAARAPLFPAAPPPQALGVSEPAAFTAAATSAAAAESAVSSPAFPPAAGLAASPFFGGREALESLKPFTTVDAEGLGQPLAQIFKTYILSRRTDALLIIDQHAAAERVRYEALKAAFLRHGRVESTGLLIPHTRQLRPTAAVFYGEHRDLWAALGWRYSLSGRRMILEALPAWADLDSVTALMDDMEAALEETDPASALESRLMPLLAKAACYGSVRAGRTLQPAEMDALLRAMEQTPRGFVCNHGRPTVALLSRKALARLFDR